MIRDLAQFQEEAAERGYTHDFGAGEKSLAEMARANPHIVSSATFDLGTDPGDDVTVYLIEAGREKGYLMVSDSFHADPRKAAFITKMLDSR